MSELKMHVLLRFSKKTGKIDTTMTGLGSAQMQLWALTNTPKTKGTLVIERDTGNVIFATNGQPDNMPIVETNCGSCEEYGIPLEALQQITDDRFDK